MVPNKHPIAAALQGMADVYNQCERLMARLREKLGTALKELAHAEFDDLEPRYLDNQMVSAQGFFVALRPKVQGQRYAAARLDVCLVLSNTETEQPRFAPMQPYLLLSLTKPLASNDDCLELLRDNEFDLGLHDGSPWLMVSRNVAPGPWKGQPANSWWAFATRLLEIVDDESLDIRAVAPVVQLLRDFDPDMPRPPGAFQFEQLDGHWSAVEP